MSERATIEIIGSSRKYIHQYEISDNFNLPNSSLKKHCVIPIVGKYNGYTIETDVINGKMNGKTIVRNEDGVIMEEMNLVNDSREGEYSAWGNDKALVFRGMYDDQRNGIGFSYEDGEVDRIIRYEMDVAKIEYKKRSDMDGYWEERDVSTNKIIAISQLNNEYEREGHCYVFNNSGSIVSANIYSKGNCHMYKSFENDTMTIYDKNGYRVYVGGYRKNMKVDYPCNGKGKCYNVNNGIVEVVYEGDYVNNKWKGEGEYYINGRRRYKGRMENGYACGEGKYYDEDGVIKASGEWKYGYLNVSGNKWLNFESGKYEKGKELCRLKDVKKRGGEYKSLVEDFLDNDYFYIFLFSLLFVYGVCCWVFSFFFHHTLLQVFSCILGSLYILSVIIVALYYYEFDIDIPDIFIDICCYSSLVWQIICVASWMMEIMICILHSQSVSIWLWNIIVGVIVIVIDIIIMWRFKDFLSDDWDYYVGDDKIVYLFGCVLVFAYGMFNWIFSFFFNHTLLQIFSCILGVLCFICYLFGIRYIINNEKKSGEHWFISYVLYSIWLIVCIIAWVIQIVFIVKRDESPSLWIWNVCIGAVAFIVSLSIALYKPEPSPSPNLYDTELEENGFDEDELSVYEEDEDEFDVVPEVPLPLPPPVCPSLPVVRPSLPVVRSIPSPPRLLRSYPPIPDLPAL